MQRGPYRFIRHPFYSAYLLGYAAGAVATTSLVMVAVLGFMGAVYGRAAWLEERKFARSAFNRDYEAFRARTGMLMPSVVKWLAHRG